MTQHSDGEMASNQVGPEAVPVPPGYRFVSSMRMVPVVEAEAEVERLRKLATVVDIYLYSQTELGRDPDGVLREALDAASGRDGGSDGVS